MSKRKKIPQDIKQHVLHESGYCCANPNCKSIITLDIHHLTEISVGGGDVSENLLPLCPNCHALYHREDIPPSSLKTWKMLLLTLNEGFNRASIDHLLALSTYDSKELSLNVSGDGLLSLSPLIVTGFAEAIMLRSGSGMPYYIVTLTKKGKSFITAWKAGDQENAINTHQST